MRERLLFSNLVSGLEGSKSYHQPAHSRPSSLSSLGVDLDSCFFLCFRSLVTSHGFGNMFLDIHMNGAAPSDELAARSVPQWNP